MDDVVEVNGVRGIPVEKLPAAQPGSPLQEEWDTYRREAPRLIEEGHEGKWVLIKGGEVVGL